ncbi:unnamed protein product [Darwinula stevensoni]|uniref:Uncharacterized protein n=1 Tax=Darwinula stevensoni TaxID=69355 RepID=A0A7R8X3Y4_9CRUS|nr:unnamed protein product [Darwinula stevensoni]CAG0878569.1 unnamed protein product [Darwinula stevensoni]
MLPWVFLLSLATSISAQRLSGQVGSAFFTTTNDHVAFRIDNEAGEMVLGGTLGLLVGDMSTAMECSDGDLCFSFANGQRLIATAEDHCVRIDWEDDTPADEYKDCFQIENGNHWYGGGGQRYQPWPIEKRNVTNAPFVAQDMLGMGEYGGVLEEYWLSTRGASLHVDKQVPLFFSIDTSTLCFQARVAFPFRGDEARLGYFVCSGTDMLALHNANIDKFLPKPSGIPDELMFRYPIWSTWARYKTVINQTIVMQFSQEILDNEYPNSQLEIDDKWEPCYGDYYFDPVKFPDPATMVQELKDAGFRVTLWIHPFSNNWCDSFDEHPQYFIKDSAGDVGLTTWWAGILAGTLDPTNPATVQWFFDTLNALRDTVGIDNFKFDAGETNWLPLDFVIDVEESLIPDGYTKAYVEMVAPFGPMLEVRVGRATQEKPFWVRMIDKNSVWTGDIAGFDTLIPTLLQFGLIGYPFVLPDMVGGNAYSGDEADKELFIRWLQVNVFMPTIQFSLTPWDYDEETIEICRQMVELHATYADTMIALAREATTTGHPINRPLWWVDPTDPETFTIDSEFLLGDDILVAPVVEQGKVTRDIYLPVGQWQDEADPEHPTYSGPMWLTDYPAPLNVLPYFTRMSP